MTLILSEKKWNTIYNQIRNEYGDAVILISWRLKDTLGFTVRRHRDYDPVNGHMKDDIRLDFYDEVKMTFFQLRYM
ncbi:hypothetical protein UFOVP257_196 [uncultured Caudovirales phage]|uniref:Uncharacterized protein n=1 Tax=uncultured Caudovirales phage TaxID=2100421 RepID=A0A6J5LH00_9CAUD|nr:hypothetical protein UFOVP257_196 [uncultured Caudovirales phage]